MTMGLPSPLDLTSYPMLVWSVCTLTITMCSQVYPDYKGCRSLRVWQCLERLHPVVTYLMVTYDGAPGELMIGIKEEHHELIGVVVSSYLCLNHPGTHKMIRWSKRREL